MFWPRTVSFLINQLIYIKNIILQQENVYEELIEKLKVRMRALRVGDSLDKCIDMGAVINQGQKEAIAKFVTDAVAEGAEVYLSFIRLCLPPSAKSVPSPDSQSYLTSQKCGINKHFLKTWKNGKIPSLILRKMMKFNCTDLK